MDKSQALDIPGRKGSLDIDRQDSGSRTSLDSSRGSFDSKEGYASDRAKFWHKERAKRVFASLPADYKDPSTCWFSP
jgi:hypothetical protein